MVAGTVDRLHRRQFAAAKAEHRKGPRPRIAAHDPFVAAMGEPDDLQLEVALVAPEPWQRRIGLRLADDAARDAAGLIDGVLHRFEPDREADERARENCAIADRRDQRIGRFEMFVDDNAIVAGQPRLGAPAHPPATRRCR